jgi:hypothetical protein
MDLSREATHASSTWVNELNDQLEGQYWEGKLLKLLEKQPDKFPVAYLVTHFGSPASTYLRIHFDWFHLSEEFVDP